MEKLKLFFKSLVPEMKKMMWPSGETVITNSSNAIIVMLVASAAVYGLDQLAQWGLKGIMNLF